MSEQSSRMQWPYPTREDDPWFDPFQDFVRAADASGFAHREDRSIIWAGGGTLTWTLGTETLDWTGVINVYSPIGAHLLQIAAGSIDEWADGEVVYVVLTRQPLENLTASLVKASQLPSTDNAMAFAVRIGDVIYFRTGISLGDGDTASGVAPVPGGGGAALEVEDEGVSVDPAVVIMDFVGAGVTATQTAPGAVEVNIPGGGGGAPQSNIWLGGGYTYTQAAVPVEEVLGNGGFDAGGVGSLTAYFTAMVTNVWQQIGGGETTRVRLYDMGPAAGPPDPTARLVSELTFTAQGGPRGAEQALTVVSSTPGTNDILDSARAYEAVVIQDPSSLGDIGYVGSVGLEVR